MRIAIRSKSQRATPVLGPIELEIAPAEAVAVLGPSGIGKTTLLGLVAGLDADFAGGIAGAGRISMVFQTPRLLPWRSVAENVTLASGVDPARAEALLAEVGLAGRGADFPGQLSLGQQRRVALARAFAVQPETLLLDEAFASLDPAGARRMQALLARLLAAHPTRMLMVTHAAEEAARLADRVVLLGGRPAGVIREIALERPRETRDPAWIAAAAERIDRAAVAGEPDAGPPETTTPPRP